MSVPSFQSWFRPLLERISDGEIHEMSSLYEQLADDMGLSQDDRAEMLPSGKQFTYRNRIAWARTYLKKAGLLESPGRGEVRITERGKKVIADPPEKLNVRFLKRFPSFVEFHAPSSDAEESQSKVDDDDDGETPEEALGRLYRGIRAELAAELLDRIRTAPPEFFERLVVDLLLKMGYGGSREDAGHRVGKSGDGGIDGIIDEDPLGLEKVCIQAKRWENTVNRPVVQAFAGSLEGYRAKKGVLITTSNFSQGAIEYAAQIEKRIVLIDGTKLASLMIQYDLAVSTVATYELKRVDSDYFDDE